MQAANITQHNDLVVINRVARLARDVYLVMKEALHGHNLRVESEDVRIVVRDLWGELADPKDVALVPLDKECPPADKQAVLLWNGCRLALGWQHHLLDVLMHQSGVAEKVRTKDVNIDESIKNQDRPVVRLSPGDKCTVRRNNCLHTVCQFFMIRFREDWIMDLAGVQYGHADPALRLKDYQRNIGNDMTGPQIKRHRFGEVHKQVTSYSGKTQLSRLTLSATNEVDDEVNKAQGQSKALTTALLYGDNPEWKKVAGQLVDVIKAVVRKYLEDEHNSGYLEKDSKNVSRVTKKKRQGH